MAMMDSELPIKLFVFDIDDVIGVMSENIYETYDKFDKFLVFDMNYYSYAQFIIRPHILDFITKIVSNNFRIAIWSAGAQFYVKHVVMCLNNLIKVPVNWAFIWSVCQCDKLNYIKDLTKIQQQFSEYKNYPQLITFFDDTMQHIQYNQSKGFNCVLVPKFKINTPDEFFAQYKIM